MFCAFLVVITKESCIFALPFSEKDEKQKDYSIGKKQNNK